MTGRRVAVTVVVLAIGGMAAFAATPVGKDLLFHMMPLRWTGEAKRLARVLRLGPGSSVADVGSGSGALIVELARLAGPSGRAFASERTAQQRDAIAARARSSGVDVSVIEAADSVTNLPDSCCDAITMRMVMHHITDRAAFVRDLRRALRPDGRVAIIDFAPGALPHLAHDHGVAPQDVIEPFTAAGFQVASRDDTWGGRSYLIVFTPR